MGNKGFNFKALSPPNLEELYKQLEDFVYQNRSIAQIHSLGFSAEGRDIKAVDLTDKTVPLSEKEITVIICGRHGDEIGAHASGLMLLQWLASKDAAHIRERQLLMIVPVANPDGFVRGEFFAPKDKLSEVEINTIGSLVETYLPDTLIDIHSLGRGDLEAIILAHSEHRGEDDFIYGILASRMLKGAEAAGFPFLVHTLGLQEPPPWTNVHYNNFICHKCYTHCHSIVFGLEVNHFALDLKNTALSAIAAIKPLLQSGNIRFPWERHLGYPNRILKGNLLTSIRSTGMDARERRLSREETWRNRSLFEEPKRKMLNERTIRIWTKYYGEPLSHYFCMCSRIRGKPNVARVRLNENEIEFFTCQDDCSTYVFADVRASEKGSYEFIIEF